MGEVVPLFLEVLLPVVMVPLLPQKMIQMKNQVRMLCWNLCSVPSFIFERNLVLMFGLEFTNWPSLFFLLYDFFSEYTSFRPRCAFLLLTKEVFCFFVLYM